MTSTPIPWKHLRKVLIVFAPLWCGAAILFGIVGAGYTVLSPEVYSARQPLVVRDEATTSFDRLGRFSSQTELKAAQETILEMTQNPEVVSAALRQIGPPPGEVAAGWPSTETIDSTASKRVNLLAPKGSEFGNTEVVYLRVEAETGVRAGEFCLAMFDNLTEQLRKVRKVRADSVIEELTHSRDLAKRELDESAARLREMEIQFGTDLAELRNLNDAISGDGTNRRTLEETTRELQTVEFNLEKLVSLHDLLVSGSEDPQQLLISGGDLLATQPSLQRLKEGLIDAQIASSQLEGVYTTENPKRRAAIAAEHEIERRMQVETTAVIRAMAPMIRLERERLARLQERASQLRSRLSLLATARTDYAKVDAEVSGKTRSLADAERLLAEATASRSAALSTNLISELGPPQVSEYPIGPSGTSVTLGAVMAGLVFGLGAVFLVAPGPTGTRSGRRWSDYLGAGRRSSDFEMASRGVAESAPSADASKERRQDRALTDRRE